MGRDAYGNFASLGCVSSIKVKRDVAALDSMFPGAAQISQGDELVGRASQLEVGRRGASR